jgi:hypothetical protein
MNESPRYDIEKCCRSGVVSAMSRMRDLEMLVDIQVRVHDRVMVAVFTACSTAVWTAAHTGVKGVSIWSQRER